MPAALVMINGRPGGVHPRIYRLATARGACFAIAPALELTTAYSIRRRLLADRAWLTARKRG